MKAQAQSALLAGALLLTGATAVRAQDAQPDPRWQAWLGCWEPMEAEAAAQLVCVIPATGTSAAEILTVRDGRIVAREHVDATGARVASTRNGCTGWESAQWSPQGQRVYSRSDYACPDGLRRSASGLMAMSATGEWLDVQGAALAGGQTGVRVRRYREAGALSQSALPEEIASVPRSGVRAVAAARAAAGASLATADVVEATRHLEAAVVEAWLAARGQGFAIDAKGLVTLADAGVPTRVIDLVVALSYPKVFAVNPASRQAEFLRRLPDSLRYGAGVAVAYPNPYGYSPFDWDYSYNYDGYGPYGWNPYAPYGYGFGYDGYTGGAPVIIVVRADVTPRPHGRLVNGHGYSEGSSAGTTNQPTPAPQPWTGGSSTGASAGRASSPATSRGSSASSGARTAKPRQ